MPLPTVSLAISSWGSTRKSPISGFLAKRRASFRARTVFPLPAGPKTVAVNPSPRPPWSMGPKCRASTGTGTPSSTPVMYSPSTGWSGKSSSALSLVKR